MNDIKRAVSRLRGSVYRAFFGDMPHGRIDWWRARFADAGLEKTYQSSLLIDDLPKDRIVLFISISVYALFGVLDAITFTEHLTQVLTVRLVVCAPFAYFLIVITGLKTVKPYFQYMNAAVLLIGSISIVYMIGLMEPNAGSSYIIGILTVFVVFSCFLRLYFPVAAAVYLIVFAVFSMTTVVISPKTPSEIAAGHFFMMAITVVALLTSYMQEIRSRIDFLCRQQRVMDATFIEKLLIKAKAGSI